MSYPFILKSQTEQVFVGYSFFVFVVKPITTLSGKVIYYKILKKIKIIKVVRIKIKKLLKKEFLILLNDLKFLVRFFFLVAFIYEPFQLFFSKLGQHFFVIFGLLSYKLMVKIFPCFLFLYFKIKNTLLIQKIIDYFQTEYIEQDEQLFLYYFLICMLAFFEILVFLLQTSFILLGTICLGQKSEIVLSNLNHFLEPFRKSKNLISLIIDLLVIVKNLLMDKFNYEIEEWNKTTNNFSRVCRLCLWFMYFLIIISYICYLKNVGSNIIKSIKFYYYS